MTNFFRKFLGSVDFVLKFFIDLFGPKGGEFFLEYTKKIAPVINKAYPIVKKIAMITPIRTDDAICAAYEAFGLKDYFEAVGESVEAQKLALRNLAKLALKDTIKDKQLEDWILNSAVELAYSQYKAETIAEKADPLKALDNI